NVSMGTSRSSSGSPSGVALVPIWVPDLPAPAEGVVAPPPQEPTDTPPESEQQVEVSVPRAPARRFATARSNLGRFATSGNREALGRALGHYVGTGLGGSRTALKRLGGTIRTADTF